VNFPASETGKYGIEAIDPDEFVMSQLDLARHVVLRVAKRHRESLKRPAKTVDEYLATLEEQQLVQTAAELRKYRELI
jgi:hypothetical protein